MCLTTCTHAYTHVQMSVVNMLASPLTRPQKCLTMYIHAYTHTYTHIQVPGVTMLASPLPISTHGTTHTPVRSNNSDMSSASSLSGAQTLRIDGHKDGADWRARDGDRDTLHDLTVKFHGLESQLQAVQVGIVRECVCMWCVCGLVCFRRFATRVLSLAVYCMKTTCVYVCVRVPLVCIQPVSEKEVLPQHARVAVSGTENWNGVYTHIRTKGSDRLCAVFSLKIVIIMVVGLGSYRHHAWRGHTYCMAWSHICIVVCIQVCMHTYRCTRANAERARGAPKAAGIPERKNTCIHSYNIYTHTYAHTQMQREQEELRRLNEEQRERIAARDRELQEVSSF
jgi:hypothetical protein